VEGEEGKRGKFKKRITQMVGNIERKTKTEKPQ
jgi:hypothetical protein